MPPLQMTPPPCSLGKGRLFGSSGGAWSAHSTGAVGGSDPSSTDPHRHQKPPPSGAVVRYHAVQLGCIIAPLA
ncbi:hypothetical protein L2E82_48434 [Cichorium intybus]|uniref:Uncharacterized protein n=1 Tax=Cichorium intybus TaxID=13427 RepID=A0ACB8YYD9_CICIN|nr:hypothetical protein L2E82_48434 [Cichorium intybus]